MTSDPAATTLSLEPNILELRNQDGVAEPAVRSDLWLRPGHYLLTVGPGGPWTGAAKTYRVDIDSGTAPPGSADQEPNDDPTLAAPVAGAFEASGDAAGTDDYLAWQVPETTEPGLWMLEVQGAIGTSLWMTLTDAEGAVMGDVRSEPDGTARMPDLGLTPGLHAIRLLGTSEPASPYILRAFRSDVPIADPEPNDDPARALPIIPGELMSGRPARPGDWDAYRLTVDEVLGSTLIDARLIVQTGPSRRLCLHQLTPSDRGLGEEVRELTCAEEPQGATLDSLLLEPGDYQLVVAGAQSLVDPYYLRVDSSVAPQGDFELEPNDTPALATPMRSGEKMRGRLDNPDHIRVRVTGEPQLWQVEARGPDTRLLWVRTDGYAQGFGSDPTARGSAASSRTPTSSPVTTGSAWMAPATTS